MMVVPAMIAVRFLVLLERDEDQVERSVGIWEVIWTGRCEYGWETDLVGTYGGQNTIRDGSDCSERV